MSATSMTRRLALLTLPSVVATRVVTAQPNAEGGRRVALVIGNGAYRNVDRLTNPVNDARLMAQTLRGGGFRLVGDGPQLDLDKRRLDRAVQDFGRAVQGADVALFYYSGHGMQVQGTNWLMPVDSSPTGARDLDFHAVDAALVLRQLEGSGTRLNFLILDACRNNPFASRGVRATGSGLAEMRAPEGTIISYATQPGNVAADGAGTNSPYTAALADAMRQPGLDVFRLFNQVGLSVRAATAGQQQPWFASSPISGQFYFSTEPATIIPAAPPAPMRATPSAPSRFDGAWLITQTCPTTPNGARALTFSFGGVVRGGALRGERGVPGQPAWLRFEGVIEPDGSAVISARGLTGGSEYTLGRLPNGTPYSYVVHARFDHQRGTGTRQGGRECSIAFARP
ncbi:MAG: hypothetical protein JWO26_3755 [Rhodospirillales bacterium]|nr:hypothetical protein [Rhodospirillales bacterium]